MQILKAGALYGRFLGTTGFARGAPFRPRIRSGLRAWTHSHPVGCPSFVRLTFVELTH